MSGSIIATPDYKAKDWQTGWDQVEKGRLSIIPLTLTNYDATTVPQIASGSVVEISGAIFQFSSNETITGTPTDANINYIMLTVSGSGSTQEVDASWTTTAPTWSDSKQGYYDATVAKRYVGGCFYLTSGTLYAAKWVYFDRDSGPQTRYLAIPFVGEVEGAGTIATNGGSVAFGTNAIVHYPVFLPNGVIVTELFSYGQATTGTVTVNLRNSLHTASTDTTMATTSHSGGAAADTDTSISDQIIDNITKAYRIEASTGGTATGINLFGLRITYITTRSLP